VRRIPNVTGEALVDDGVLEKAENSADLQNGIEILLRSGFARVVVLELVNKVVLGIPEEILRPYAHRAISTCVGTASKFWVPLLSLEVQARLVIACVSPTTTRLSDYCAGLGRGRSQR
jgi:hypothetical protein